MLLLREECFWRAHANASALILDQLALSQVLQDGIDSLSGQSDEVRDIALTQPQRNDHAVGIVNAMVSGKIDQRVRNARMSALEEQFFDAGSVRLLLSGC